MKMEAARSLVPTSPIIRSICARAAARSGAASTERAAS
jgi:hypothetical protein